MFVEVDMPVHDKAEKLKKRRCRSNERPIRRSSHTRCQGERAQ